MWSHNCDGDCSRFGLGGRFASTRSDLGPALQPSSANAHFRERTVARTLQRLVVWRFVRFRPGSRIAIEVIIVLAGNGFGIRTPCLPCRLEQRQLFFRQLLTLAVALRFQQFAQQTLILVLLGQRTIQLFGQIHHNLPQCLCIPWQTVRIDGHRISSLRGNRSVSK